MTPPSTSVTPFYIDQPGTEADTAFADACYDYGLAGHNLVMIAAKDSFVSLETEPIAYAHARCIARRIIRTRDPRFSGAGSPAGALPIIGGRRRHVLEIPPCSDGYIDLAAAAAAAPVLMQTEQIIWPRIGGAYQTGSGGRIVGGTVFVHTRGADTHTGWLSFGTAPRRSRTHALRQRSGVCRRRWPEGQPSIGRPR